MTVKPSEIQKAQTQPLGDEAIDREVVMTFISELEDQGYIKFVGRKRDDLSWVKCLQGIEECWNIFRWGSRFGERNK